MGLQWETPDQQNDAADAVMDALRYYDLDGPQSCTVLARCLGTGLSLAPAYMRAELVEAMVRVIRAAALHDDNAC